jgi:hypothetical protein
MPERACKKAALEQPDMDHEQFDDLMNCPDFLSGFGDLSLFGLVYDMRWAKTRS